MDASPPPRGLALRAATETTTAGWRKFVSANGAAAQQWVLHVSYNTRPAVPVPTVTGGARVATSAVDFHATVNDADPGEAICAIYQIYNAVSGALVTTVQGATTTPGGDSPATVTLADGSYTVRAAASNGRYDWNKVPDWSAFSPVVAFTVEGAAVDNLISNSGASDIPDEDVTAVPAGSGGGQSSSVSASPVRIVTGIVSGSDAMAASLRTTSATVLTVKPTTLTGAVAAQFPQPGTAVYLPAATPALTYMHRPHPYDSGGLAGVDAYEMTTAAGATVATFRVASSVIAELQNTGDDDEDGGGNSTYNLVGGDGKVIGSVVVGAFDQDGEDVAFTVAPSGFDIAITFTKPASAVSAAAGVFLVDGDVEDIDPFAVEDDPVTPDAPPGAPEQTPDCGTAGGDGAGDYLCGPTTITATADDAGVLAGPTTRSQMRVLNDCAHSTNSTFTSRFDWHRRRCEHAKVTIRTFLPIGGWTDNVVTLRWILRTDINIRRPVNDVNQINHGIELTLTSVTCSIPSACGKLDFSVQAGVGCGAMTKLVCVPARPDFPGDILTTSHAYSKEIAQRIDSTDFKDNQVRHPNWDRYFAEIVVRCTTCKKDTGSAIAPERIIRATLAAPPEMACTRALVQRWGCVWRNTLNTTGVPKPILPQPDSAVNFTRDYPEVAHHGLWVTQHGAPYNTLVYTRASPSAARKVRGRISTRCRRAAHITGDIDLTVRTPPTPTPKAYVQCDEFPFASMREGSGTRQVISPADYTNVWAVYCRDNWNHGQAVGRFYREQRLLPGDKFKLDYTGSASTSPSPLWDSHPYLSDPRRIRCTSGDDLPF